MVKFTPTNHRSTNEHNDEGRMVSIVFSEGRVPTFDTRYEVQETNKE